MARSGTSSRDPTPSKLRADRLSESDQFKYATIPLHLSFQKLMDRIQEAVQVRRDADCRPLAASEWRASFSGRARRRASRWNSGWFWRPFWDVSFSRRWPAAGLALRRSKVAFASISKSGSPAQAQSALFLGNSGRAIESSLFSALGAISSETVSSWSPSELSSWAAAVLSSWASAGESSAGWSGEALSSWSETAQSSWGAGALSSWLKGAESSWAQAAISSWLQGAESSWAQAAIQLAARDEAVGRRHLKLAQGPKAVGRRRHFSWLQGAESSWAQAAISSWLQGAQSSWAQAAVSSWGSAAVTSWAKAPSRAGRAPLNG